MEDIKVEDVFVKVLWEPVKNSPGTYEYIKVDFYLKGGGVTAEEEKEICGLMRRGMKVKHEVHTAGSIKPPFETLDFENLTDYDIRQLTE